MNDKNFHEFIFNELNILSGRDKSPNNNKIKRKIINEFGLDMEINSSGFRGPDFLKNIDLLFIGCSHTFGQGIREEDIWGVRLAKKNNWSYNNISYPGASVMHLVYSVFKYFEEYSNPKYLIANFPPYVRIRSYVDHTYLTGSYKSNPNPDYSEYGPHNVYGDENKKNYEKFIKLPTTANKIFSDEFTYMLNSMFISILEKYCKENNIIFIWSKWGVQDLDIGAENFFKNEYKFDKNIIKLQYKENLLDCSHPEINYRDTYYLASDKEHFGSHWHLHVAEHFERIINDNFRN
jgi:hypothetical protein